MRRIVHDYIGAAITRVTPGLEQFIAGHLECPAAVPLVFSHPVAAIREVGSIKVTPRLPGDFPPVDIVVTMRVAITAGTRHRGVDIGVRTFRIDVELDALGTVAGHGYDVVPQRARLTAWWGTISLMG